MTDLDKAREWAEQRAHSELVFEGAAARLIQSLPDQWVDAGRLRQIIDFQGSSISDEARKDLETLFTPQLPTLADMTQEERAACQWMQVKTWCEVGILVWVDEASGIAEIITQNNGALERKFKDVIPLPGEPKLKWPGSEPDDVAYATGGVLTTQDVVDECRAVRKERALPRPEDVPDPHPGEAWLVNTREGEQREALKAGNRWYIKDGDDVEEWVEEALNPISRLVPESHTLPEGMRLAGHEEYGRVVTSPWGDGDDDYKIFFLNEDARGGADYDFAHESRLTFLDGDQHV